MMGEGTMGEGTTSPFRNILDEHDGEKVRNQIRWRKTLEFIREGGNLSVLKHYLSLDIGDRGVLTVQLEGLFEASFVNTTIDLDIEEMELIVDFPGGRIPLGRMVITCFEVLEHLFNPLHCLMEMRKVLIPEGRIYLSTPRRKPLCIWDPHHFHEMSDKSLFALIERAGLTVVRRKKIFIAPWRGLLTGFRPWLRLFVDRVWLLELKHS